MAASDLTKTLKTLARDRAGLSAGTKTCICITHSLQTSPNKTAIFTWFTNGFRPLYSILCSCPALFGSLFDHNRSIISHQNKSVFSPSQMVSIRLPTCPKRQHMHQKSDVPLIAAAVSWQPGLGMKDSLWQGKIACRPVRLLCLTKVKLLVKNIFRGLYGVLECLFFFTKNIYKENKLVQKDHSKLARKYTSTHVN